MTKQQYIEALKDINSEYLYRDFGYGGFNENGDFIVQGQKVTLTLEDVRGMYDIEAGALLAEWAREQ